ncbi:MAG: hypothetical protein OXH15_00815 [Gammaproteobacteria bacterium]|nr:hypothetical protein [Gammaproteobacteria bacterium]
MKRAVAVALLVLVGCETLQSGTPGEWTKAVGGWPNAAPTLEILCSDTGSHTLYVNLIAGWEPSGPGTARVDGSGPHEVRWHRLMEAGRWIAFAGVLAEAPDGAGMGNIVGWFRNRDDYTPPPAALAPLVREGSVLSITFEGYSGGAAWDFDLEAVRVESAEKCEGGGG